MEDIDFSKIYSYSKLDRFEKCKKQYYLHYLDPEISPIRKQFIKPRDYKTKGQAVHGAITLFYHLPPDKRTFKELKNCLSKAWFSEIDPAKNPPLGKVGGFNSLGHERKVYAESLKLLKNFFGLDKPELQTFYLPTEKIRDSFDDYKELIKPLNKQFSISGKFDRIDELEDGALRIIDFKTSKENKNKFQLLFYKLLAELNFKKPIKIVSFYNLNKGNILEFDVSNIKLNRIKKQVSEKIKTIENLKEFKLEISGLCLHCDFLEICPAKKIIKIRNKKYARSNYC